MSHVPRVSARGTKEGSTQHYKVNKSTQLRNRTLGERLKAKQQSVILAQQPGSPGFQAVVPARAEDVMQTGIFMPGTVAPTAHTQ